MGFLRFVVQDKTMAEVMMEFGESMKPVYEFIEGQKKDLESRGFNTHVADMMTAELFRHILWLMRGQKST
jgi:hypothetical protein